VPAAGFPIGGHRLAASPHDGLSRRSWRRQGDGHALAASGQRTSLAAIARGARATPPGRPSHLLTWDAASKGFEAAALANYPGATVLRIETGSNGVYEAHLWTADGQRATAEVGKEFAVTGLESTPRRPRCTAARLAARLDDGPRPGGGSSSARPLAMLG
jgi:hypothetical protein